MTSPRHHLVDATNAGYYHCMSRCVRRAFLCGDDRVSGQSFEHRKAWISDRAIELAGIFAVGLYAYAVMSNHVHLVLYLDPLAVDQWSDTEVAERWLRLFPVRENGEVDVEACRLRPLRQASCRPDRISITGAKELENGSIWTSVQGPCGGAIAAA